MKAYFKICLIMLLPISATAQQHLPDSTVNAFKNASNDSLKYRANRLAYFYFEEINRDSALFYVQRSLLLAQKNNKKLALAFTLASKGYQLTIKGLYADALKNILQGFEIARDPKSASNSWMSNQKYTPEENRLLVMSLLHHMFGVLMDRTENKPQMIAQYEEAKKIAGQINNSLRILLADMNIGNAYIDLNKLDSAYLFENEARQLAIKTGQLKYLGYVLGSLGDISLKKGDKVNAKKLYYESVYSAIGQNNVSNQAWVYARLTDFYLGNKNKDSSLYFAKKMLQTYKVMGPSTSRQVNLGIAYQNLYLSYKLRNQLDSAFKYAGLTVTVKDSLYRERIANLAQFQNVTFQEQFRFQRLQKERDDFQSRVRNYALLAGLGVFLVIALLLYRNNRLKREDNKVLQNTLTDLRATQTQLIQSEKMASLGELTAGIAHEIQNPLNFVNNFSDVNDEMIDELKEELKSGNVDEALSLAGDIQENERKIRHHGKRADSIVKGMLEHSRTGTGEKQPTDLNALADEYLRLSYHGLRAKDKDFNAELVTNFDAGLPKVNVVPQDMSRVLLNLFNNAFYAVNEKQKTAGTDYKPEVTVSTSAPQAPPVSGGAKVIIISVKDNGNGIPDAIRDKIMQPFFTTKPTGEGTGLGLSLSYDIVVKGHGGSIVVDTKENEFTEFTIQLPI